MSLLRSDYESKNYKRLLFGVLERLAADNARAHTQTRLADACGVNKTFLSRVFNGSAHLSAEQVFLACAFLRLEPEQRDFALLLHAHDVARPGPYKSSLQERLIALRAEKAQAKAALASDSALRVEELSLYFAEPHFQLVHMCCFLPGLAKDAAALARTLHLSESRVRRILRWLESAQLISSTDEGFKPRVAALHLPHDSPFVDVYRQQMRTHALQRLSRDAPGSFSFSTLFTADEATRKIIKGKLLDVLKECQALVAHAPSRDLFQLNIDLFSWLDD